MNKQNTMASITAILLAVLLIASFALIPMVEAQTENQTIDEICTAWIAEKVVEDFDYLIDIITIPNYQPNPENICEVWVHTNNQTLLGLLILIEKAEKLLDENK